MRPVLDDALAKLPETTAALSRKLVEDLQTIKMLCLSRVHDDNTMWGLYAENHRGVVLEFANADGFDSVYRLAKPVDYLDKAPPLLTDDEVANFLAGNVALSNKNFAEQLVRFKSKHWLYEQEVRIITGKGRKPDAEYEDVRFYPRELVAIYFGARASALRAELEPLVKQKYPHAQRWQASQGAGFRIAFSHLM